MRRYWDPLIETWWGYALNSEIQEEFENTPASVVIAGGLLTYAIPSGYQPAGEPFEHALSGEDVTLWVPLLKGATSTDHGATHWSLAPCLHQLDMATAELITEHVLAPLEPSVQRFRDAVTRDNFRARLTAGLRQPGLIPWGLIAAAGADLYGILVVGDWAIPQCDFANQLWAVNLKTGARIDLSGYASVPQQLLRLDSDGSVLAPSLDPEFEPPEDEAVQFDPLSHPRKNWTVLGRTSAGRVLIAREDSNMWARCQSNFGTVRWTITAPSYAAGAGTNLALQSDFESKWLRNAEQTFEGDGEIDPELLTIHTDPYCWPHPELSCGDLPGEPWSSKQADRFGAYSTEDPPPESAYLAWARTESEARSELQDALANDLETCLSARVHSVVPSAAAWVLEEWDFSGSSPSLVREIAASGLTDRDGLDLWCAESSYAWYEGTIAELGGYSTEAWPVPGGGSITYRRPLPIPGADSSDGYDFRSRGSGVQAWRTTARNADYAEVDEFGNTTYTSSHRRHFLWSMHVNNCPGPNGIAAVGVDDEFLWFRAWRTNAGTAALPAPPSHGLAYCTDGSILCWLPRSTGIELGPASDAGTYNSRLLAQQRIACVDLATSEPTELWALSTIAEVGGAHPVIGGVAQSYYEATAGGACSNGFITRGFLYVVIEGEHGGTRAHYLLQIRLRDSDAGDAGEVVSKIRLATGYLRADTEAYRDQLLVVNRRCLAISETDFFAQEDTIFEITAA